MKEKILLLRGQGLSYNAIQKELNCSKSTIAYHCGEGQKKKSAIRRRKSFNNNRYLTSLRRRYSNVHVQYDKINKITCRRNKSFSFKEFKELIESVKVCYITGREINYNESRSWEIDHIIPIAKGGKTELNNLMPVTKVGNRMKSDHTLDELILICREILKFNKEVRSTIG